MSIGEGKKVSAKGVFYVWRVVDDAVHREKYCVISNNGVNVPIHALYCTILFFYARALKHSGTAQAVK